MGPTLLLALALAGCTPPDKGPAPILQVSATESWSIPELTSTVQVVRVESDIPHIYAGNRADLIRVAGFEQARDRYFEMEMARRLGLGELSALLGDAALGTDMESRGNGMTFIVDRMLERIPPDQKQMLGWFADGINAYVAAVKAGDLPVPSELQVAGPLLGHQDPTEMMSTWTDRDVAGILGTLLYNLGYETGDVGRQRTVDQLANLPDMGPYPQTRDDGVVQDIWDRIEPVFPVSSAAGWGLDTADQRQVPPTARPVAPSGLPGGMLDRLDTRQDRLQHRLGHDWMSGWGSNAWAVAGSASTDGRALLAGDGHLPLTVPPYFYQIGLHDEDPDHKLDQVGLVIPGMPVMAVGTNGYVAWSQTQLMGDITDWYREEVKLDANGEPTATWFQGEWKPLTKVEETYDIADVPLLGSTGRTETWARWVTFDGRWIAAIEGDPATATTTPGDGQTLVSMQGDYVIPRDTDDDGIVSAVSFDYAGFDVMSLIGGVDGFGHAHDVQEFREATRSLVAYSQNMVAADKNGSILYTGYQAVPCRAYLPHDENGWAPGADPSLLLDGTKYGGFTIPMNADGTVDESHPDDPYRCVVPFDDYPAAIDPAKGYVLTANNDPGNISTDGTLLNDPWYIGGPWLEGYRAHRIDDVLDQDVADGTADLAAMQTLQSDHYSLLGEQLLPMLYEAIDAGRTASQQVAPGPLASRLADLYNQDPTAINEVETRLKAWEHAGRLARSGVDTFYDPIQDGDHDAAVATTLFNAWMGRFMTGTFDDERLPGVWEPSGATGRLRALNLLIAGRGADNPLGLASWVSDTNESILFDHPGTEPIETSDEIALEALVGALDYLRSHPTDDGHGGFGTDDMDQWIWGLRHWVHFDSILKAFLGNDPTYAFLIDRFNITPATIPMGGDLDNLPGFPRHGGELNVDAGNSGLSGHDFNYGSGPNFRMVFALGPDGVEGQNVIPGGESGLTDSDHFADQAKLWLGNETLPVRFTDA